MTAVVTLPCRVAFDANGQRLTGLPQRKGHLAAGGGIILARLGRAVGDGGECPNWQDNCQLKPYSSAN